MVSLEKVSFMRELYVCDILLLLVVVDDGVRNSLHDIQFSQRNSHRSDHVVAAIGIIIPALDGDLMIR